MYTPYMLKKTDKAKHINLLLTEREGIRHYSTIVDFSRLSRSQVSKPKRKMHFCYSCLTGFSTKNRLETRDRCERLKKHEELCYSHQPQRVSYPIEGKDNVLKFNMIRKQLRAPFRVYVDFEAALVDVFSGDVSTGILNQEQLEKHLSNPPMCLTKSGEKAWREQEQKSFIYQEHRPISYKYIIVSDLPDFETETVEYKGEYGQYGRNLCSAVTKSLVTNSLFSVNLACMKI